MPYRTLSRPAITRWEQRKARERLRTLGRAEVNEGLLFQTISQMREIAEKATKAQKRLRRDRERLRHLSPHQVKQELLVPSDGDVPLAKSFPDIEEW